MKLTQIFHLMFILSVISLTNISCATEPSKSSEPTPEGKMRPDAIPLTANSFKYNEKGLLIPLNKDGQEFVPCRTKEKNTCAIFNRQVTFIEMKTTTITKMVYKVNPKCIVYMIDFGDGFPFYWTDPADVNCAKFN